MILFSRGWEDSRVESVADIVAAGSWLRFIRSLADFSRELLTCSMVLRYLLPNCRNSDKVISCGNVSERFLNRLI